MKNIAIIFRILFTVLNYLVYLFLLVTLIAATQDKSILEDVNIQWWMAFLILEIWFNTVIARKSEIKDPQE
jgi:Mn2+/Fe2+ NRAMP family transporter